MTIVSDQSSQIELQAFCAENADLVLSWRNTNRVRTNSLDDKLITKDEHLQFIDRLLNKPRVHYFVVLINNQPEAVINVDASEKIATWGCYIGSGDAPKPGIFPLLTLIACHLAFNFYHTSEIRSEVIEQNDAPQKLNKYLGIKKTGCRVITRVSGVRIKVIEYSLIRDEFPLIKEKAMGLLTKNFREIFSDFEAADGRNGDA